MTGTKYEATCVVVKSGMWDYYARVFTIRKMGSLCTRG